MREPHSFSIIPPARQFSASHPQTLILQSDAKTPSQLPLVSSGSRTPAAERRRLPRNRRDDVPHDSQEPVPRPCGANTASLCLATLANDRPNCGRSLASVVYDTLLIGLLHCHLLTCHEGCTYVWMAVRWRSPCPASQSRL